MSATEGRPIRVLVVDDQELIRAGLRGILRASFGFQIVGECSHGGEVAGAVHALHPDVVLMDVRMPVLDGIEATRRLREDPSAPPVLALTTFEDDEVLAGMLRAGAAGFVLKGLPAEDLQRAVRAIAGGDGAHGPLKILGRQALQHEAGGSGSQHPGQDLVVLERRQRQDGRGARVRA